MKKVAILYICTGAYVAFWKDFYLSFEKKFLPKTQKDYFVFTDAKSVYNEEKNTRIHRIYQDDLGWPGNTLFRFRIFKSVFSELNNFDYIFFMNANMFCNTVVTEEEFLPVSEELLVTQHPGFYDCKPYEFSYERRKKSLAYIPYSKGHVYVCGGVNGGKAKAFIELIRELDWRVDKDNEKGIVAAWHDESHLNRYILEHENYKLLSPAYCYPEGWELPFEKKLIVLDKGKKIKLDQKKISNQNKKMKILNRVLRKIQLLYWKIAYSFRE